MPVVKSVEAFKGLMFAVEKTAKVSAGYSIANDRRSPTRPRFIEAWRKSIRCGREREVEDTERACVSVWIARTEILSRARHINALLSSDDREAVYRLRAPAARESALAAKVLLRLGLSQTVKRRVTPTEWRFDRTLFGKPLMGAGLPDIKFSVSHTDAVVAIAASAAVNVGVDIELIDQAVAEETIAEICHADEQSALRQMHPQQRLREFIRLWTEKEAYTKLVGRGHSIDFRLLRSTRYRPPNAAGSSNAPHFESFFVTAGFSLYHAALAVETPIANCRSVDIELIDVVATGTTSTLACAANDPAP